MASSLTKLFRSTITKRSSSTIFTRSYSNNAFISPFIITALNHPKTNHHSMKNQNNHIWINNDMHRFCSNPKSYPDPDTDKNTAKPRKSYVDTEELQESKINVPGSEKPKEKTTMQKIKEYGAVGMGVYCSLWFGMYGIIYCAIHWNFLDIGYVAKLIPSAEEKINSALSSTWGEAAVAVVINEAMEVVRLPFSLMITPPIAKIFKKEKTT